MPLREMPRTSSPATAKRSRRCLKTQTKCGMVRPDDRTNSGERAPPNTANQVGRPMVLRHAQRYSEFIRAM